MEMSGEHDPPRAAKAARGIHPMVSVTIDSPNQAIAAEWDDLVRRASSNVFMNPAALQAAGETDFADLRLMLAWERGTAPRRLVGVWAMRLRKVAPLWPRFLEALPYDYAFLSSPVIDPAFADDVMAAFLAAIEQNSSLPNVISMKALDAESPGYQAMSKFFAGRGITPLPILEYERPVVTREFGVKRSGATRKKLRQDWNRLTALGRTDVVNDRTPEAVGPAFETFLALEKASWKGAQGTALLSDPADAAFVRKLLQHLAAKGDASVALLQVNGAAIAAQVLMYCGTTAYTWKTAYDAAYAKFSPGTLLIDRVTDQLLAGPDILAINSCADEASFMTHLWTGRRRMVDLLVDVGRARSPQYHLEAMRQLGYERLRDLRDQIRHQMTALRAKKLEPAAGGA
jgi:CelD/BcsL family acetyltransferase involved in cellulose biosynthesis